MQELLMTKFFIGFGGFLLGLTVAVIAYRGAPAIIPAVETIVGLCVVEGVIGLIAMFIAARFFHNPRQGVSDTWGLLLIRASFSVVVWIITVTVVMLGMPMGKTLGTCAAIFTVANAVHVMYGHKFAATTSAYLDEEDDDFENDR
jgi:uncharacterized membrane-anchored protein